MGRPRQFPPSLGSTPAAIGSDSELKNFKTSGHIFLGCISFHSHKLHQILHFYSDHNHAQPKHYRDGPQAQAEPLSSLLGGLAVEEGELKPDLTRRSTKISGAKTAAVELLFLGSKSTHSQGNMVKHLDLIYTY